MGYDLGINGLLKPQKVSNSLKRLLLSERVVGQEIE